MAKKHKYRVRVVFVKCLEPDGGWDETDTEYDDAEVEDGAEDLKEE